ncbi:MAG: hypothetical protein M1818_003684 [Claussenomyces sp. TS43310]|nr:MAG: hypothetical protein M1818_003684 [Claussenomyces sp. TS43310]
MPFAGPRPLRVAIIGGGLSGLTLGQLLQDVPHISVVLYERSKGPIDRLSGYRVMISAWTLKNLKGTLRQTVWNRIAQSIGSQPPEGQEICFMKSNGEALYTWAPEEVQEQYSTSRWKLREGLLEESDSFARFGKMFERYKELPNGSIRVYFTDGTSDECDLLVGADGINSRVRKQLLPDAKIVTSDQVVIYFKIALTPATLALMQTNSGVMAFCPNNQHIIVHSWQNPLKPWATEYNAHDIEPSESFIMFGYSSTRDCFLNRTNIPEELSREELKGELIARAKRDKNVHPHFAALAERCITNTAYLHVVKNCDAIKPWESRSVTLVGDAVFNMATTLGKGANCALLDAISLAETLSLPPKKILSQPLLRRELRKFTVDNIDRRLRERQRSGLLQNLMFFGNSRFKSYFRQKLLKAALGYIEDPKTESGRRATKERLQKRRPGTAISQVSYASSSGSSSVLSGETFLEREFGMVKIYDPDVVSVNSGVQSSGSTVSVTSR